MKQIVGTVSYRERMALPPGAEVEVQFEDVSRADALATVLASVVMTPEQGPPYDFSISYDPGQIDERMTYGLRATIRVEGKLMFTSTEFINAFGDSPIEIWVSRVPRAPAAPGPALDGTDWVLNTLLGEAPAESSNGERPDLRFDADKKQVGGFSGCNRFSGGYSREGSQPQGTPLKLGPLAGTLRACMKGDELERSYLKVLSEVNAYRLEDDTLSLLSGGEIKATFKPR